MAASTQAERWEDWRGRFETAWPEIAALGFDDRFRRMWLYYLTYCEVGFERGLIDVGLYRLRKPASARCDRHSTDQLRVLSTKKVQDDDAA